MVISEGFAYFVTFIVNLTNFAIVYITDSSLYLKNKKISIKFYYNHYNTESKSFKEKLLSLMLRIPISISKLQLKGTDVVWMNKKGLQTLKLQ